MDARAAARAAVEEIAGRRVALSQRVGGRGAHRRPGRRAGSGPLTVAMCAEDDALPEIGHAPAFAAHRTRPAADPALVDGAIAMAWTAIDAAADPALRARLLGGG
jgi:hypothetical protein